MNINLAKYAPLGLPYQKEIKLFGFGIGLSGGYSLTFIFRYLAALDALYYKESGQKILLPDAVMTPITELLGRVFIGFQILALFLIFAMIYHYVYHYQGSKSIYLMKRLPNRTELYRRCFTLPVLGILISIVTAILLLLIYYFIYIIFTPEQCFVPNSWQMIWR